jgi:hypothetical protein
MAEAVSNATEIVAMARELEAHGQRESGDQRKLLIPGSG